MAKRDQLTYTPIQSFVESSFFTKLSERKLNEYKLDATTKPIWGFMTSPQQLNKFNDRPIINLDYSSFEQLTADNLTRPVLGQLHNVNTIEEFKQLDKLKLLKDWCQELKHGMIEGKVGEKFQLLTFSDLKKYKFYYWLAFPTLHSLWTVVEKTNNNEYELQIEHSLGKSSSTFFQISPEIDEIVEIAELVAGDQGKFVFLDSCISPDGAPLILLKNYLYFVAAKGFKAITLFVYRNNGLSYTLKLQLDPLFSALDEPKVTGWERSVQGKLGPKLADLGSLINPNQLAEQAVDLNLKLMKWRVAPELDLDVVKNQKVLLLGAGTLGSYVSRVLMGWGVREITFVDNGRVSYSNPVRQPLFSFKDCFSDLNQGVFKAQRASEALKEIFPGVKSTGYNMEVPMIGHPVSGSNEDQVRESYETLERLFSEHDVIFLLMDSRESRWIPTLMGVLQNKIVINAALGFDGYLVMRHSPLDMDDRLGCYYCNDVVAPTDSLTDRSLDQMCTVTRPGGALMASSLAVELLVSILQHPKKQYALAKDGTKFGQTPHQIRGFLHTFEQSKLSIPAYKHCSACSNPVVELYQQEKWEFVKKCLNSTEYLETVCGLKKVQEEAELASAAMLEELSFSDEDDDF